MICESTDLFPEESQVSDDEIEGDDVNLSRLSSYDDGNIAIAFTGGSLKASCAGMAILRGFQQKKIVTYSNGRIRRTIPAMNRVKYNSGCSGGSIPVMLYSYAQVPVDELLDTKRTRNPAKITTKSLNEMSESSMFSCVTKLRVDRACCFLLSNLSNLYRTHSYISAVAYEKFLKKYNVPKNKYITSGEEELERIMESRIDPKIREDQFLLPRKDIKTLPIVITSMRGSRFDLTDAYKRKWKKIYSAVWDEYHSNRSSSSSETRANIPKSRMTKAVLANRDSVGDGNIPIPYTISPNVVETRYSGDVKLKKSIVKFPLDPVVPFRWGEEKGNFGNKRFSVEFMLGLAINSVGMKTGFTFLSSIRKIKLDDDGSRGTQLFADGGLNDCTGILPALQQDDIKNIIFVQSHNKSHIAEETTAYADIYRAGSSTKLTDPNFNRDFKEWLKMMSPKLTCLFGSFGFEKEFSQEIVLNHVFHDPNQNNLKELMIKFNALFEAGEPLVATLHNLRLIENPFWGIPSTNRRVNLTIIHYNMPKKFSEKVPTQAVPPPKGMGKIDRDGRFNNEEFRCIPEIPTRLNAYFYSNAQVNMFGYLGSWIIERSWDGLRNKDGELVFEGFSDFFENTVMLEE